MAVTTALTTDISQALAEILLAANLRTYWYISDATRPPAVVIMQPSVDYTDTLSGFCAATWTFPLTLMVARANDREAQVELSQMLQQVVSALAAAQVPGIQLIEPVDARPVAVTVAGQELPAYSLNVRVRA